MLRELKINELVNTGNQYRVECIINEGSYSDFTDPITGEAEQIFNRSFLQDFVLIFDEVPTTKIGLIALSKTTACDQYGYNIADFI